MSLWADYYKETHGVECIEHDWGFAAYRIMPEGLRIEDFYIVPEARATPRMDELLEQVYAAARAHGKLKVFTRVSVDSATRHMSIRSQLSRGFSLVGAAEGGVWFTKDLEAIHG